MQVGSVVPGDEVRHPGTGMLEVPKPAGVAGGVFDGLEKALDVGVVVTHSRAAVGGTHPQHVQQRQQGEAFHRPPVVGMQVYAA